ncbi:MAG: SH3 domain-containing protein [Anaerolineae bacterium]|nr:SH3 domain-containing protein [Anaerolineae bacterium]
MELLGRKRWLRLFTFLLLPLLAGALLLGSAASVAAQTDDDVFSEDVVTATTTVNLNLRAEPGLAGQILATLPAGTVVGFTGFMDGTGDWVQVDSEGNPVGWVAARFLSNVPAELQVRPADVEDEGAAEETEDVPEDVFSEDVVTATTTVNLNLRDAPGLAAVILDTLPAGSVVGFTGFTDATGAWVQVDAEGYPVGWVAGRFLSSVPAQLQPVDAEAEETAEEPEDVPEDIFSEDVVTATTTVNLNLRDAPGLDAVILDTLPAGSVVGFTGFTDTTGDWVQVDAEGYPVGWVAARFLSDVPAGLTAWEGDA